MSNIYQRAGSVTRKSRPWEPIRETVKKPGDWRQTRDGWERVPVE